jgi:pimeloyl-ACP methyl ester carboxylesterase
MPETIYMIHGMWVGPWCWNGYRSVFEEQGHRCVATTLPFHDADPRDAPDPRLGSMGLLDYAEVLEGELRRLRTKPILMGHSMGGLLAQILAARGLAKAVVLLAPAAPAGILVLAPSVIQSFWSIQTTWGFWRRPVRPTPEEAAYSVLHLLTEEERQDTYQKFVYESGRTVFEIGYWFLDAHGASRVDESKVDCPVLVVAGAHDRITPASTARRVALKYETVSTYREFAAHAHWLVAEPGWEEVAGYVGEWLHKLKTPTGKVRQRVCPRPAARRR